MLPVAVPKQLLSQPYIAVALVDKILTSEDVLNHIVSIFVGATYVMHKSDQAVQDYVRDVDDFIVNAEHIGLEYLALLAICELEDIA